MPNEILTHNICRMIAQTYAIDLKRVVECFEKTRSVDQVLNIIEKGDLK